MFCSNCGHRLQVPIESQNEMVGDQHPQATTDSKATTGPAEPAEFDEKYRGIRGWLAFLCINLTVIGPVLNILFVWFNYSTLSMLDAVGESYSGVSLIIVLEILFGIGLTVFSIYAGLSLWKKKPHAVSIARTFFYTAAVYIILDAFMVSTIDIPGNSLGQNLLSTGREFGPIVLWLLYLQRSRRVKATFNPPK